MAEREGRVALTVNSARALPKHTEELALRIGGVPGYMFPSSSFSLQLNLPPPNPPSSWASLLLCWLSPSNMILLVSLPLSSSPSLSHSFPCPSILSLSLPLISLSLPLISLPPSLPLSSSSPLTHTISISFVRRQPLHRPPSGIPNHPDSLGWVCDIALTHQGDPYKVLYSSTTTTSTTTTPCFSHFAQYTV